MLGEVENPKKLEKNRGLGNPLKLSRWTAFRAIFRPRADFSKKQSKKEHAADAADAADPPETESRPAAQTLGTVRMLSGLRS